MSVVFFFSAAALLLLFSVTAPCAAYIFMGPRAARGVVPKMTVSMATNKVIKVANNSYLAATANGGLFRTDELTDERIKSRDFEHSVPWYSVADEQNDSDSAADDSSDVFTCSSFTQALFASPASNLTRVYAGCGSSTSSTMGYSWTLRNENDWNGLFFSRDGGKRWARVGGGFPAGLSIESVVELESGAVLVAAKALLWDQLSGGGVYRCESWQRMEFAGTRISSASCWTQVYSANPVFSLVEASRGFVLASTARASDVSQTVIASFDGGQSWTNFSRGLPERWFPPASSPVSSLPGQQHSQQQQRSRTMVPFVSTLAISKSKRHLFLGVLVGTEELVSVGLGAAMGKVFYLNLTNMIRDDGDGSGGGGGWSHINNNSSNNENVTWQLVGRQPFLAHPATPNTQCNTSDGFPKSCQSLDATMSTKDNIALAVASSSGRSDEEKTLFIAANGDWIIYRIDDWTAVLDQTQICTYSSLPVTSCLEGGVTTSLLPSVTMPTVTSATSQSNSSSSSNSSSVWKNMWNKPPLPADVAADSGAPHADCRGILVDEQNDLLILATDGGIFIRTKPFLRASDFDSQQQQQLPQRVNVSDIRWWSANNLPGAEVYDAAYDPVADRFIAAIQDNSVQVSLPNASTNSRAHPVSTAIALPMGADGTKVAIDYSGAYPKSNNSRGGSALAPLRFFASVQFSLFGIAHVALPANSTTHADIYSSGEFSVTSLRKAFPDLLSVSPQRRFAVFPFFQSAFAVRDGILFIAANKSSTTSTGKSGVFSGNVSVDASAGGGGGGDNDSSSSSGGGHDHTDDDSRLRLEIDTMGEAVQVVIAVTGTSTLIAASAFSIFIKDVSGSTTAVKQRKFPIPFAEPMMSVPADYCASYYSDKVVPCLHDSTRTNWPNHAATISVAAHPSVPSRIIAVSGWSKLTQPIRGQQQQRQRQQQNGTDNSNDDAEHIFLTVDGGLTWTDVFSSDLVALTKTVKNVRAMALSFVSGAPSASNSDRGNDEDRAEIGFGEMSSDRLVAGTNTMMIQMSLRQSQWGKWSPLRSAGSKSSEQQQQQQQQLQQRSRLPIVKISSTQYLPPPVDVLLIATMGRGVWKLKDVSKLPLPIEVVTTTTASSTSTTTTTSSTATATMEESATSATMQNITGNESFASTAAAAAPTESGLSTTTTSIALIASFAAAIIIVGFALTYHAQVKKKRSAADRNEALQGRDLIGVNDASETLYSLPLDTPVLSPATSDAGGVGQHRVAMSTADQMLTTLQEQEEGET